MKKNKKNPVINASVTHSANSTNNSMQFRRYRSKQGHGWAAEDANAMSDRLRGKKVELVGDNNALNGADRITNGIKIQTKYCQTAKESINSTFNNDSYRYEGMKLEVPKEQYNDAIKLMAEKIKEGKVKGVSDPMLAKDIVLKGKHTYNEAKNIAKAGNIDSIKFDIKTQAITCSITCGLSILYSYTNCIKEGKSHKEALEIAVKQSIKAGGATLCIGVATQQLLRTSAGRTIAAVATNASRAVVNNICKTQLGTKVIEAAAKSTAGKVVGETAKATIVKGMRTNMVTSSVALIGQTGYDAIKLYQGKISGKQLCKNIASNTAGMAGGYAGATAGAAIGTMILPGIGTAIGGLIGSIGAGITASSLVNKACSKFD